MDNLASFIEHTNLSPTLTGTDIDRLVAEAKQYSFLGICVPPFWVKRAKREIGESKIILVTVAGFPLGYSQTETKLAEIKHAIDDGADEIDVVWNVSAFKSNLPWAKMEIAKCSKLVHDYQRALKVIIEIAYLNEDEIVEACKLCVDAGADFVKTSTGFAPSGANAVNVQLMRQSVPSTVGVKASGGIKTKAQAIEMIQAGANRIGTSSGIIICG